jgi:AraC-like DNA-binding protein
MATRACEVPAEGSTDAISPVLQVLRLDARVYHSGEICRTASYPDRTGPGMFHFLIRGAIRLQVADQPEPRVIDEPTLIGFPYAAPHRLDPIPGQSHHLVCAQLLPGNETARAVLRALPNPLLLPLREAREMALIGELLLGEADPDRQGSLAARDLYARAMMLAAIRYSLDQGCAQPGILRAMQDPRIARVLSAVLSAPKSDWTVAGMAQLAGMSRSAFAASFVPITGLTPQAFVTSVRIDLATELMARGHSVKQVAREVGYASASTFGRAFRTVTGRAPSAGAAEPAD